MSGIAANQVVDRCGSTNDLARQLGEAGAEHGTWISARIQDAGRGRLGRKWESLEGNLFLSLIARIEDKSLWTWVPLTAAVSIARCLKAHYPELALRIKWPNDLASGGLKLSGILCEGVGTRAGSFMIIGLGLNCEHAPEGLDQETTSLTQALSPRKITADLLRQDVISHLLQALDELVVDGISAIVADFNRWAALPQGTAIEWTHSGSEVPQYGTVLGLGPAGELLVETPIGNLKLFAEDVRLRSRTASGGSLA